MPLVRKIALLVRTGGDIAECIRSAQGMALDNLKVGVFIIDAAVAVGDDHGEFLERLEMLDDLEARIYTTVPADTKRFQTFHFMTASEMAAELPSYDLLIPFQG